jgi:hypothetical protein
MGEPLMYKGTLEGHTNWVTAIATSSENPDMILTASRGTSIKPRQSKVLTLIIQLPFPSALFQTPISASHLSRIDQIIRYDE